MLKIEHNTTRILFVLLSTQTASKWPHHRRLSIPFIQRKNATSTILPPSCSDADISCYCRFDPEMIRTEKNDFKRTPKRAKSTWEHGSSTCQEYAGVFEYSIQLICAEFLRHRLSLILIHSFRLPARCQNGPRLPCRHFLQHSKGKARWSTKLR